MIEYSREDLDSFTDSVGLAPPVLSAVRDLWKRIDEHFEWPVWIPHCGPTESGDFISTWDKGSHHFEVEIDSGGDIEWFYRCRETENVFHSWDHSRASNDTGLGFLLLTLGANFIGSDESTDG